MNDEAAGFSARDGMAEAPSRPIATRVENFVTSISLAGRLAVEPPLRHPYLSRRLTARQARGLEDGSVDRRPDRRQCASRGGRAGECEQFLQAGEVGSGRQPILLLIRLMATCGNCGCQRGSPLDRDLDNSVDDVRLRSLGRKSVNRFSRVSARKFSRSFKASIIPASACW